MPNDEKDAVILELSKSNSEITKICVELTAKYAERDKRKSSTISKLITAVIVAFICMAFMASAIVALNTIPYFCADYGELQGDTQIQYDVTESEQNMEGD